jgi:hypothetical protein
VYAPTTTPASPYTNRCHPRPLGFTLSNILQRFPATISPTHIKENMKFLLFISNAFINTMGITQPSPQAAKRAAWFIFAMLIAVIAAIITIAAIAIHWASYHQAFLPVTESPLPLKTLFHPSCRGV